MNPRRLVLTIVVLVGALAATDILIHNVWLHEAYRRTSYYLWRPEIEMIERSAWMLWGDLLAATMLAVLWAAFTGPGSLRRAVLFALCVGLYRQADVLFSYATQPLPGDLALKIFLANVAQSALLGVIVWRVYKPPPPDMTPERRRKIALRWLVATGIAAALIMAKAWYFNGSSHYRVPATAPWMKALESNWAFCNPGKSYSVQSVADLKKDGEDSLRFELRGGETFLDFLGRGSFRTEVDFQDYPPLRSVRWYAFSLYLPQDFPKEDNRLVIVQWHGSDKKLQGEASRNPSMAFRYVNGKFYITVKHSPDRIVKDPKKVPQETLFETNAFAHGQWHDFIVQVKWSYQDDGFVNVWWNRDRIVQYRGPVGYNDNDGPYFRLGLYRDPTDKTYVIYFNQVKFGVNPEEIGLSPQISFQ